jgi:lipoprotein-anchoring transpeptidase ErfK/SrfK
MASPLLAQPSVPVTKKAEPGIDLTIMHVQVLLDHLGFGPGVIDGRKGASLKKALIGFQTAKNLPKSGEIDAATLAALKPYSDVRPTAEVVLTAADLTGPFVGAMPKDPAAQAKLSAMAYQNVTEQLAERFHTTAATLLALNGPQARLAVGARVKVPGVAITSTAYDEKLKPEWRATLASLSVDAQQPKADHIVVDKSDGVLRVYDGEEKLVAQFPATMGSSHDPLPVGSWKIQGAAYNPPFHYNPGLFWDADSSDEKQLLKPGPNGPVGVVWLDLNKPHYGIHGTPSPETIGRAESHGCIRLTNWDAARLSLMVKPGTAAKFQL